MHLFDIHSFDNYTFYVRKLYVLFAVVPLYYRHHPLCYDLSFLCADILISNKVEYSLMIL